MTVKILIADDQVLLSRALATILGSQPDLEVVATVHDGQAAVDTVAHTSVDLVLMDVRMPKLDGVAALKKIRAKPNPPKIVMLTTFNVPDTVKASLTAGANGFLLKEADPETLIESVRTVAAGQTVLAAQPCPAGIIAAHPQGNGGAARHRGGQNKRGNRRGTGDFRNHGKNPRE